MSDLGQTAKSLMVGSEKQTFEYTLTYLALNNLQSLMVGPLNKNPVIRLALWSNGLEYLTSVREGLGLIPTRVITLIRIFDGCLLLCHD